jgi:predicted Rossmann fold nucleotide-binding protein DprA/Smf involved in DNA uptake
MPTFPERIISGGQTGADRAALDFALDNGFKTGGFVPKGRIAEDGIIPERYPDLLETETADPDVRTRLNVENSDGTLVFSHGEPCGGSALTIEVAAALGRPYRHIDLFRLEIDSDAKTTRIWLSQKKIRTLNVAGARASEDQAIYRQVKTYLSKLLK